MKGDRVEIVIDAGGDTRTYEIEATRAGRRVDVTHGRGVVEVTETTRGGTPVRTARFMAGAGGRRAAVPPRGVSQESPAEGFDDVGVVTVRDPGRG